MNKLDIFSHFNFTDNPHEAIFLLEDCRMIDGEFDCGMRGVDHNIIIGAIGGNHMDRSKAWDIIHDDFRVVRLVPETKIALINTTQELTQEQQQIIDYLDYEIERY